MLRNRAILDKRNPKELVLELLSFSGGENTIGEDHELENNEARKIENWEATSLGGMTRQKGFTRISTGSLADLMIRFNGSDGATEYTAETGQTVTFAGTAQLDTAQKKFGASSLLLDGNSDWVTLPDSDDWTFGTGDFTVDLWVRFNSTSGIQTFYSQYASSSSYVLFRKDDNGKLQFLYNSGSVEVANYITTTAPTINTGTWYHVAVVRSGAEIKIALDGTFLTLTETTAVSTNSLADIAAVLKVGANQSSQLVNGWIDEFRVVKGYALWTDDFTPPSESLVAKGEVDLIAEHLDEVYAVSAGDLGLISSGDILLEDDNALTSGELCHAVSAGGDLWITNDTDNLKYKTNSTSAIAAPTGTPTASERVYYMNNRLIVEGNSSNTIEGSRVGSGNWKGADAWSASNDAWSITSQVRTRGCVPAFPSGTELTYFTDQDTYVIYNQPGVLRRKVTNGIGCHAPYSIAKGNEGVFFLSNSPTLGIFLWDSVNYINLTEKHDFVDDINLDGRIFGVYRDRKYYFVYNEFGSGVSYPNRLKIYDTRFGRWHSRPVNTDISDNFGYPCLLTRDDNKLYCGSSRRDIVYELEDSSTSDNGNDTEADYETKIFNSRDFRMSDGNVFPIDSVRLKLIKAVLVCKGNSGDISISWDVDRGKQTGSKSFSIADGTTGDLINTTFTVNSSSIIEFDNFEDKVKKGTFPNSAVGREFQFNILNSGTGIRTEVKRLKIYAVALEDI